jgi:NB-ARC domain/TIR domain/APAF-1 helical domain
MTTRLFLSYARADDPEYVARLTADLSRHGFEVWLDRGSMESRGESLDAEILQAIIVADRMILVSGPQASRSEYVLWECRQGLDRCKPIVPILRRGGPDLLPAELARVHYVEAGEGSDYERGLAELLRLLRSPLGALGKLFAVPERPPHYFVRGDAIHDVKAALLADHHQPVVVTGAAQTLGIFGMGGIGKTVLATAVARDCEVRRAFPDGVFWRSIGQGSAGVRRHQLDLLEALGGSAADVLADGNRLQTRLGDLLADRAVLLVLDDVWQIDQVTAFGALGPRCRMLVTSRNAGLVTDLGAVERPLDLLSDDQALRFLADWVSQPCNQLPSEAQEVARRCGNLPLALAMVGAMVRNKPHRWHGVLRKFNQVDLAGVTRALPNYPHPSLLQAIEVSVADLPPAAQQRLVELAVFPDGMAIRTAALQVLWRAMAIDLAQAEDALEVLVDHSLLTRGAGGELHLHDLLYDYVRTRAPDAGQLHRHLLRGYAEACPAGWQSGPDDGYFFEHLAFHLRASGRGHELFALLTGSNEWMEAKFGPCQGDASFLADLELAAADLVEPMQPADVSRWIALLSARLVVRERVYRYEDDDLAILTLLGRGREALNHARLRDPAARIRSLLIIEEAQRQRGRPDAGLLDEAVATLNSVHDDDYERQRALNELARTLLSAQDRRLAAVLDELLEIVPTLGGPRAWAMCELSALLLAAGDPRAGDALDAARAAALELGASCNYLQRPALAALRCGLLEIVKDFTGLLYGTDRIEVLCAQALAMHRAGDERSHTLLQMAEQQTRGRFPWTVDFATGLGAVAEALSAAADPRAGAVFQEAVAAARAITEQDEVTAPETNQDIALLYIAQAAARGGRFELAERTGRVIGWFGRRHDALRFLCKQLALAGDARAAALFAEIVASERAIQLHSSNTSDTLYDLAAALTRVGQLDGAWSVAHSISALDPLRQADALAAVAAALTAQGRETDANIAFKEAAAALDRDQSANHLGGEWRLVRALAWNGHAAEAERWANENRVFNTAPLIVKGFALQGQFELAEARARDIGDEMDRASALLDIAAVGISRGHESADRLYTEAAALLRSKSDWNSERREALAEITIELGRLRDAEGIIDQIGAPGGHDHLLQELAIAQAQRRELAAAERIARRIERDDWRIATLAELAVVALQVGDDARHGRLLAELRGMPAASAAVRLLKIRTELRLAGGDLAAVDALARSIEGHRFMWSRPSLVIESAAVWLAAAGRFREAFDELGSPLFLDKAIKALADWVPAFERVEPGLALDVLRASLRIAGWQRGEWAAAAQALAAPAPCRRPAAHGP